MARSSKHVTGHISRVQEERFCLVDDSGKGFLFDLSHNANIGAADLWSLYRARVPVAVAYEGESDEASGVAHTVRRAEAAAAGARGHGSAGEISNG